MNPFLIAFAQAGSVYHSLQDGTECFVETLYPPNLLKGTVAEPAQTQLWLIGTCPCHVQQLSSIRCPGCGSKTKKLSTVQQSLEVSSRFEPRYSLCERTPHRYLWQALGLTFGSCHAVVHYLQRTSDHSATPGLTLGVDA